MVICNTWGLTTLNRQVLPQATMAARTMLHREVLLSLSTCIPNGANSQECPHIYPSVCLPFLFEGEHIVLMGLERNAPHASLVSQGSTTSAEGCPCYLKRGGDPPSAAPHQPGLLQKHSAALQNHNSVEHCPELNIHSFRVTSHTQSPAAEAWPHCLCHVLMLGGRAYRWISSE